MGTFESGVCALPESLGIAKNAVFPNEPCDKRCKEKREGEKSAHKGKGREHHQVVPVEDAAGGAAAGVHHQPKRAPDENTYQIANIKENRNEQKSDFADKFCTIDSADSEGEQKP